MFRIPKSAKILIDVQGQALKARIISSDKDEIVLDNVDSINTVLRNIYEKEGNSIGDLINDKRVTINSSKVWGKYDLSSGKYFVKKEKESVVAPEKVEPVTSVTPEKSTPVETVTPVTPEKSTPVETVTPVTPEASTPVETVTSVTPEESELVGSDGAIPLVGDEEPNKEKPTNKKGFKVRLKQIGTGLLVLGVGAFIICGGAQELWNRLFGHKYDGNDNNDNDNKGRITSQDLEDGSTHQLPSDAEVIQNMAKENENNADPFYVPEEEVRSNPVESFNVYDYSNKGSNIIYDNMAEQIDVINTACDSLTPCELQNLVIDEEYDTIHAICSMRNQVLTGNCSPERFMNNVINYVYENSYIFNDREIKPYISLSPYSSYIVLVASETILPLCENYEYTSATENVYRAKELYEEYDYMIDIAYRNLTNNQKSR